MRSCGVYSKSIIMLMSMINDSLSLQSQMRNVDLFVYFYDIQVYFNLYLFDESIKFICVYVCVENLLICVWIEE